MTHAAARARKRALWRAAPSRLLRTPTWLLLILVAATLLVGSVVAPPLFVAAARATALEAGLVAAAGAPFGTDSADLRVTWDGMLQPADEVGVVERLTDMRGYGAPALGAVAVGQSRTQRATVASEGQQAASVLWSHDGAVEALGGDPDAEGVWLSTDVAAELGIEVGDPLRTGLVSTFSDTGPTLRPTVLAGTYETAPGSTLPVEVAALPDSERWFRPANPDGGGAGTPLAIAGRSTFNKLVRATGETPLYTADLLVDPDLTPDEATLAAEDVKQLGTDAYDVSTQLAAELRGADPYGAQLSLATGLPDLAFEANSSADSARSQVQPYALAGQLLAAVLLVAAWVLLGRSRRREQLLASGLGLRPGEIGLIAALEVIPVSLVAVPLGVGLAVLGVSVAGPPDAVRTGLIAGDLTRAAAAAALSVALIALTSVVIAWSTDRQSRMSRFGAGRRGVPWGLVLLAVTGIIALSVYATETVDRSQAPLTVFLPLLVCGSVAMIVARCSLWLRGRWPGRAGRGAPRWLATRRSGPMLREVTALTIVVAVALGLFAYSLSVHRGIDQGVADKTAALAGARSSIEVADDLRGQGTRRAVDPPVDGTTVVWRRSVSLPPTFGEQPLMAIDPETFADVADWGGSGVLEPGRDLLDQLDPKAEGLPAILAGTTDQVVGDQGTLDFSSEFAVPYVVVGVVPALPGSETETGDVAVVVSSSRLLKLLPPTVDPRAKGATRGEAGALASWIWSDQSSAELRADLDDAGLATDGTAFTATDARIESGLVASTWAAGYVLALGVVILVLALAAALVLALRLADRDTIADVLLRRMGYAPGELARSRTWEVAYAVGTAALAAVLAVAVLTLLPTSVDAAAAIPPLTRPRPGGSGVIAFVVVPVIMIVLALLIGLWRARHRADAEVLRAGA